MTFRGKDDKVSAGVRTGRAIQRAFGSGEDPDMTVDQPAGARPRKRRPAPDHPNKKGADNMRLRGIVAGATLAGGVLLSATSVIHHTDLPDTRAGGDDTLALAPISLGNPAAAAGGSTPRPTPSTTCTSGWDHSSSA